ncbi:MAG: sialidase family protein [Kiritimatiellae bacterium]|jgi:hypothetical protein|nr:sialidase family protein [Kiritimatiellia bacterium]
MFKKHLAIIFLSTISFIANAQLVPSYKKVHVLQDSASFSDRSYLAFPALIDLGIDILVSYKRGKTHAQDPDASLDMIRIGKTGEATSCGSIAAVDGEIMQMGEWVRFSDGTIANYIDVQKKGSPSRVGLKAVRSTDGGKTFGAVKRVGVIDGVEYGYAFEAITKGKTTWMLVMTFNNLEGGKYPFKRPRLAGSVDVIRSEDNGSSWHFVRSITRELNNAPINESSFAICSDGFIVAARGYDKKQWLMRTDSEFKIKHKVNVTKKNEFITSYVGRPRVFQRDSGWYLLGRNFVAPKTPMRLSMFKFDPETLTVTKHVLLDNDTGEKVADGYYAMPYWRKAEDKTEFNVVTYKRNAEIKGIIRLAFDWNEVR